ncbi:hypothetical protein ACKWTF_003086 [Chironomus riparius]
MTKGAEIETQRKSKQDLLNKFISDAKQTEESHEMDNKEEELDVKEIGNIEEIENEKEVSEGYITNINNNTMKSNMEVDITSDCSSTGDLDTEHSKEKHSSELSDTDSALSSINTIESGKTASKESIDEASTVYVGEIVWGSFRQTSWFPCLIYPSENGPSSNKVLVKYFNYNGLTAYLPLRNVFEFEGIEEFWHEITQVRGIKRSKITAFKKSCRRAIEQAKCFKAFPICDRVNLLDRITEFEKKFTKNLDELDAYIDELVDENPIRENLKLFFRTIKKYDESVEVLEKEADIKKEIKPEPSEKPIIIKTEETEELKDSLNRRLSTRTLGRKRKFDEIKEEIEDISSIEENIQIEDESLNSPALKKPKIKREETLEERFLSEIKDVHYPFRNVSKSKACTKCLEKGEQSTYRCSGKNCANWFHESCFEKVEWRKEQFRHKTGDSDDIIVTESTRAFYTCTSCIKDEKQCFVCHQDVPKDEKEIFNCTNPECKLLYHEKCLNRWPKNRGSCPQHYCHTCHSKSINKNGGLAKCMQCVASYHAEIGCVPAGTQILSRTQIICPRHKSEKEQIKRNKNKSKFKPLNIDWCSICTKGGELVCCEGCPNAFHKVCLGDKYQDNDDVFMCDECLDGRLPLYNTIVWARLGNYRWWPGFLMLPWTVPHQILKRQEFEREFCIRFFGSNDFCFATCERVFPYDLQTEDIYTNIKSGNKRLDSLYQLALLEADQMKKILNDENEKKIEKDTKPKFYNKVTQNRPVPPVKLKKIGEHSLETCDCNSNDASPCGKNSNCINMLLNFECDKKCPSGIKCQNQKLRNRENSEIKIVKTKSRGFGAVCVNDIEPDTFIIEYVGELIDNAELNRRMDGKIKRKEREFYFLTVESDLFVDAEFYANKSRFLNHSCDPNCETRKVTVDGNTRIGIFSKKFIQAGTELTFDYQMQFVSNLKTNCYCESVNCTGLIGDAKKIEEEKKIKIKKVKKSKRKNDIKSVVQKRVERISANFLIDNTPNPFDLMMEMI